MTENEAIELLNIHKSTLEKGGYIGGKDAVLEYDIAVKALEEIQQYRTIGTVEECQEARERQIPMKPIKEKIFKTTVYYQCPICGCLLTPHKKFCEGCSQKLAWSE